MKTWMKASICVTLSFMFCFLSIGFASLTDTLTISGSANVEIPSGLFIIDISTSKESSVDKNEASYLKYTTTVDSSINRANSGAGSVTYQITVLNNTRLTYSYRGLYYQSPLDGYNGNSSVSTSNGNRNIGVVCSLANASVENKKVAPGQTLTFSVTYTVGRNLSASTDWNTLINFQFGINVETQEQAIDIAVAKFLDILNTDPTYLDLLDALDNKFDGRQEWTSNYIGNVTGSNSEDSVLVNTLFAGHLQITIGDTRQDATVLIKHENLDGNTMTGDDYVATNESNGGVFRGYGCEMTLYLTIDPLTTAGKYVPVYAIVFTCDRDAEGNIISDWYRIGDTYLGEANVVTYNGGNGTGSFVTDNWRAKGQNYTTVPGYSYNVNGTQYTLNAYTYNIGANVNIENIVMAKDNNANRTLQTLLTHAKKVIDSQEYAGTGITLVEEVYASLASYYTLDANGYPVLQGDYTRAELCPVISKLFYAVDEALLKMEALSQLQP